MRPLSVPVLVLLGALATGFGAVLSGYLAGQGHVLPVTGWVSGLLMLGMAAVLLVLGIPVLRYMKESEERRLHPSMSPRRHQVDLPTAYRTIVLARACAYTGAVVGGIHLGQALHFVGTGTGTLTGAVLPTAFGALAGIVLAVLGVLVERWGTLPPEDGEGEDGAQSPAG